MDAIAFDRAGPETGPYVIVVRPEGGWMWTGKMADIYEQTQEGGGIACPNSLFRIDDAHRKAIIAVACRSPAPRP
ncbi:hypothetical protein [Endobacterium cereale]|uniref:hypothetical protein n=1 Tax=Endobacterium cereale TaxID=2663029 RepID=UPI002B48B63A|nr:hypothetical protein [Endobacterium cereale]MEB2844873.1 hypothetical protein [Endobacterium cereale]